MVMLLAAVTCPRRVVVGKKKQFCAVHRAQDLNKKTHVLVLAFPPLSTCPQAYHITRLDLSFLITELF